MGSVYRASGYGLLFLIGLGLVTACGGGGGSGDRENDNDLVVVKFALVDQTGHPTGARGTTNAYRNNRITFTFSETVDPATVSDRTIQIGIPAGTNLFLTAQGRFSTDGNVVTFDPTVTATNAPHPFGLEANSVYTVTVKGHPETKTIASVRGKPVLSSFVTTFTTTDKYLPDLDQPRIVSVSPAPDAVDVGSRDDIVVEFSEAMNPATFDPAVSFRVNNLSRNGRDVFGTYRFSDDARTVTFRPTFGYGRGPYLIEATLTVDLTDLAGNSIANPQQWTFTTIFDISAVNEGLIEEYFDDNVHEDKAFTPPGAEGIAQWNPTSDPGRLVSTFGNTSTTAPNPLGPLSSGNCIPLGSGASWDSYWCQLWYASSLLGGAGTISGWKWFLYTGSAGLAPTMTGVTIQIGNSKGTTCPFATNNPRSSHWAGTPVTCVDNVSYSVPSVPAGTPVAFPTFTKAFGYDGTSNIICDLSKTSATVHTYWAIMSDGRGARAYGTPNNGTTTNGITTSYLYQCVFDFRTESSMAQSLWYRTEGNDPTYLETIVQPTEQPAGTETVVVYQGAMDDGTGQADPATVTSWTGDVRDLDGFQHLRFRASFTANLSTGMGPALTDIVIPYIFF